MKNGFVPTFQCGDGSRSGLCSVAKTKTLSSFAICRKGVSQFPAPALRGGEATKSRGGVNMCAYFIPDFHILSPLVSKLSWCSFRIVMTLKDEFQCLITANYQFDNYMKEEEV